jgi:integrase/recombinase XerC
MSDSHQLSMLNSQTDGAELASAAEVPVTLPDIIQRAGPHVVNFFAAELVNRNTRRAYVRACVRFLEWMEAHALPLETVQPSHVTAWLDAMKHDLAMTSVKQQLAALRMLFDHLVSRGMLDANPAARVAGPSFNASSNDAGVLDAEEADRLLGSIRQDSMAGLRDRALIGLMVYAHAGIHTALAMRVCDVLRGRDRWIVRLQVTDGKRRKVSCHHLLADYLFAYLNAGGLWTDLGGPLFRTIDRSSSLLSDRPLAPPDAAEAVRRRARAAGIKEQIHNQKLRRSGLTARPQAGSELR